MKTNSSILLKNTTIFNIEYQSSNLYISNTEAINIKEVVVDGAVSEQVKIKIDGTDFLIVVKNYNMQPITFHIVYKKNKKEYKEVIEVCEKDIPLTYELG